MAYSFPLIEFHHINSRCNLAVDKTDNELETEVEDANEATPMQGSRFMEKMERETPYVVHPHIVTRCALSLGPLDTCSELSN